MVGEEEEEAALLKTGGMYAGTNCSPNFSARRDLTSQE
jgi:hypothetical protein